MRRWRLIALLLSGLTTAQPGIGQEAPCPAAVPVRPVVKVAEPAPDPEVDALLAAWAERAANRTSLQVAFEVVDSCPHWGNKAFAGQAFFCESDLCVEFTAAKVGSDGQPQRREVGGRNVLDTEAQPSERIVFTREAIVRYIWDIREIDVYPLATKRAEWMGRQLDRARRFFALPFLFRMTSEEAKRRYEISLVPQKDQAQAEKSALIRIRPRDEVDKRWFREMDIDLDRTTFLPDRIALLPAGNQSRQDYIFRSIVVSPPIPDRVFATNRTLRGWRVVQNGPGNGWPVGFEEWFTELIRLNNVPPTKKVGVQ